MHSCRLICAWLFITLVSATVSAQDNASFSSPEAAISALYHDKKFTGWTAAEGDLTGDGIKDIAMIVVYLPTEGEREEHLVVLAGAADGKYSLLSASAEYCHAEKFYNLEVVKSSLYVTEVTKADGDSQTTNTLQFRYNRKFKDLELVGRENIYESFQTNSYGRLSVNYVKKVAIEFARKNGRIKATKKATIQATSLTRLNRFDCIKHFDNAPY